MKATVDPEQCIGCELCVQICPDVFAFEERVAVVITDEVPDDIAASCRQAVETCPVKAIELSD